MSLRTYSIVQVSHAIWVIIPTSQNQLLKYSSHSLKPHVGGVSYNVIIFPTAIIRLSSLIVVFQIRSIHQLHSFSKTFENHQIW